MRGPRARTVVGMGVSAAVWAAVTFTPADLGRDPPPRRQDPEPELASGPLAAVYRQVDGHLEERVPGLEPEERHRLAWAVVREAQAAGLDALLVLAVIEVESGFDLEALSGAGAKGLMQLRDATLRRELSRSGIEGDPLDPVNNVRAGVRYLRRLMDSFPGEDLALMAYNAGPNRILGFLREGEVPERFQVYPRRVKSVLRRLRRDAAPPVDQLAAVREGPRRPAPRALLD